MYLIIRTANEQNNNNKYKTNNKSMWKVRMFLVGFAGKFENQNDYGTAHYTELNTGERQRGPHATYNIIRTKGGFFIF